MIHVSVRLLLVMNFFVRNARDALDLSSNLYRTDLSRPRHLGHASFSLAALA